MIYKLNGWKKSEPSDSDLNFNLLKPTLESIASSQDEYLIPDYVSVFDQLNLNSCVANSTAGAVELLMGIQDKNSVNTLSRLFLYWNARVATSSTNVDDGTYIRDCYNSLKTLGICLESSCPYDTSKVFAQPSIEAYRQANDNKITGFYNITSDGDQKLNDIEIAIKANHPISFGISVSKEFTQSFNIKENDTLFDVPTNTVGSHAMIIIGVRTNSSGKKEFKIKNSWGNSWGYNGYCWFTEEFINSSEDLWVPTLIPTLTV